MTAAELLRRLLIEGGELHEADSCRWCSFKGGGEFDLNEAELSLLRSLAAGLPDMAYVSRDAAVEEVRFRALGLTPPATEVSPEYERLGYIVPGLAEEEERP